MGIFSGKSDKSQPADPTPEAPPAPGQKKGVPTPSRAAAERARMERINPTLDPKQAKARERALASTERAKATERQDNAPGKQLMRRVVDTRFNWGDYATPVMLSVLVLTMLSTMFPAWLSVVVMFVTWGVFLALIIDMTLLWWKYKKFAKERIPNEPTKGLLFYGINRAITFRRLRMPPVVAKRGEPV
ncbi:MAG: DUF3043 domain-containing protein [Propionibacteriaceae bacterium]|nr:DUF3043 domain-containing protein [Micropruina sp.]